MLTLMTGRSDAQLRLVGLFLRNPASRFYLRELQRTLGIPVGSLQRHLSRMKEEGVLKSEAAGPLRFFSLNPEYPYLEELRSVALSELRKLELERDLAKLLKRLKKEYSPDKVILFGSLAKGRVSPDGDIDILIVKEHLPARYWDRVKEFAPFLAGCDVGVDYTIWTPKELAGELDKNSFLRDEIVGKGRVLYERAA